MSDITRRSWTIKRVLSFSVLSMALAMFVVGAETISTLKADSRAATTSPFALYASPDGRHYFRLDPMTLDFRQDGSGIDTGTSWGWVVSADGSTMVTVEDERTIVVRDGLAGVERFRFRASTTVFPVQLSPDGARLLATFPPACNRWACPESVWSVFDTWDGREVATVHAPGDDLLPPLVDRNLHRLYRTVVAGGGEVPGSWPLELFAYDLDTGAERGHLTLSDVLYRARFPRAANGTPIFERWTPAVALSPDGTRLVVVDADVVSLTLIDTASFTIERTLTIHQHESTLSRIGHRLGLIPTAAEAKYLAGRSLGLTFTVDGRYLFLTGVEGSVDESTGASTLTGLGITKIDAETGEIGRHAIDGVHLHDVIASPDGSNLYVVGPTDLTWSGEAPAPHQLLRLDADTLTIEAKHTFSGPYAILLLPAPP